MTHLPLLRLRGATTTTLTDTDTARDARLLDAQETKTYQRFVAAVDRRDYAAAHALLRRTLTSVVPRQPPEAWCFERTAFGKPYLSAPELDGPPLRFSLSHTRGYVACAISRDGEVGVDVESRSQIDDLETLMGGVCSADEQGQVLAAPRSEQAARFLDLWSLKEAYVKACGTGIDTKLAHITFDLTAPSLIRASLPSKTTKSWCFALFRPAVDSRIAIAIAPDWASEVRLDAARVGSGGQWAPMPPSRASGPFEVVG
jgi:4'-phosphopantetheinyl transferase